jgi:mRNA-degrading endonuclease YafQ of YafQ-DinJ toxin-antitoxin module
MSRFKQSSQFAKDLKRLVKKYRSLEDDLVALEQVLLVYPTGIGKNFTIIHHAEKVKLVKARLACKSLRERSMRVIYAYHEDTITFVYIELYFKGENENEDRERIERYLQLFDGR